MWLELYFDSFLIIFPTLDYNFLVYISVSVKNLVTMSKVSFLLRLSIYLFPALCRAADDQCRALQPQFEPLSACIRACEINQSLHLAVHSCCS